MLFLLFRFNIFISLDIIFLSFLRQTKMVFVEIGIGLDLKIKPFWNKWAWIILGNYLFIPQNLNLHSIIMWNDKKFFK